MLERLVKLYNNVSQKFNVVFLYWKVSKFVCNVSVSLNNLRRSH